MTHHARLWLKEIYCDPSHKAVVKGNILSPTHNAIVKDLSPHMML